MIDRPNITSPARAMIAKLQDRGAGVCAAELEATLAEYHRTHTAAAYDATYNLIAKFKGLMAEAVA